MNPRNAIEIKNITKSFKTTTVPNKRNKVKRTTVVKDVTLNLERGEVVGIIGRNGSGKSTLLKLVSKIMEPDSGTIECFGRVASILELGMGFHQDLTGRENIYIKASMYCFSKKDIDARIESMIEYSELGDYIDAPLRLYSSGMVSKLAFAIMVNVDADIIILDEVLSTGDSAFVIKSREHIKNLKKNGRTILIVSHTISVISEMCDRVVWIENGSIREIGTAKLVCKRYETEIRESFEIVLSLANAGVAESQNTLGCMYRDGKNVEQDNEKALFWLRKSSDSGNLEAQVNLGDMLLKGIGIHADPEESLKLFTNAANRGNLDARNRVAMLSGNSLNDPIQRELREQLHHLAVKGGAKAKLNYANLLMKYIFSFDDKKEAFRWFKDAADLGNADAQYRVALMYRDGFGVEKNNSESLKYFEFSGNNGNLRAMQYLGDAYLNGIIDFDEKKSFWWHLKAAERGNPTSQYQIAVMYRDGNGVEKDDRLSESWFKSCVYSGLVGFASILSDAYSKGMQVLKDDEIAYKWHLFSAESGNVNAMYQRGIIDITGSRGEININAGFLSLCGAAERGDVRAMNTLGWMFKNGVHVSKNNTESLKWFGKSAELEHPEGLYNTAILMEKINSVDRTDLIQKAAEGGHLSAQVELGDRLLPNDEETALKWYTLAGERGNQEARMKVMKILAGIDVVKEDVERITSYNDGPNLTENLSYEYDTADTILKQAWYEEDRAHAFKTMHELAEKDNPNAMYQIGLMYRDGIGVEVDYGLMEYWLGRSANKGNPHAAMVLGDAYRKATFGKEDLELSQKYYTIAAERNNVNGMYYAALLTASCHPEISSIVSRNYAEQTLIKHYNFIANYLLNNPTKNVEEAIKWYKRAAELNDGFAMNQIAIQLRDGKSIPKNINESIDLLRKATKIGTWQSKQLLFYSLLERSTEEDLKEAISIGEELVSNGDARTMIEIGRILNERYYGLNDPQ